MSKRACSVAHSVDLDSEEANAFADARKGRAHYVFSVHDNQAAISALLWTPTRTGAKLIYFLRVTGDNNHKNFFWHSDTIATLQAMFGDPTKDDMEEYIEAIQEIIPEVSLAADLGTVELCDERTPPEIPYLVELCYSPY